MIYTQREEALQDFMEMVDNLMSAGTLSCFSDSEKSKLYGMGIQLEAILEYIRYMRCDRCGCEIEDTHQRFCYDCQVDLDVLMNELAKD